MHAIYLTGPNAFSLQTRPDPVRGRGEVEIKILMAGICGSDLHLVRGHIGYAAYPMIPGHECMGEVVAAPANSRFKPGDRVTVFPGVGCGRCPACRDGRLVHCEDFKIHGSTLPNGCFCERVTVPQHRVLPLPRRMDETVGAMIEPTAVAVHVNARATLRRRAKVVVIGGGVIGLLVAQVARDCGAGSVIISEPIAERRRIARRLAFRLVCDPLREPLPQFVAKHMGTADVVFDVVAGAQTLQDAQAVLRPDGKLVLVGFPGAKELGVSCLPIFVKELQVIGSRTYFLSDFPRAIQLLHSGRIDVRPLISRVVPLAQFGAAIDCLEREPGNYMKILINPNADGCT